MNVITVTQLNTYIKSIIESEAILSNVLIVGEISNFKHYYKSGHMYFTLKDEQTQLKAVMFSSNASRLRFKPEDGMRVICRGRIAVYDKDGVYQLYTEDMQPDGIGALSLAFEQLKEKLSKEGLFDTCHKKPIPQYPNKIGIATSNMGAAIEDIKNITKRRYPVADLVISPTIVQGASAPADIVRSIKLLDSIDDIDVIIVGRGGGSIEDLWAFNTEEVARAVFDCKKPVISAVGHETDFTICDFVADLRAETPSAAAEKAVPDITALNAFLDNTQKRLLTSLKGRLEYENQRFDYLANESVLGNYSDYFSNHRDVLENITAELCDVFERKITERKYTLSETASKLNALSPLAVLTRGFAVASDGSGSVIKSIHSLDVGSEINIKLSDGSAKCTVSEVTGNGNDI